MKKVVSLLLVLVLSLGMVTMAAADWTAGSNFGVDSNADFGPQKSDELKIDVPADAFPEFSGEAITGSPGVVRSVGGVLPWSYGKDARFTVRMRVAKGGAALANGSNSASVGNDGTKTIVKIGMANPFKNSSTDGVDVDVTVIIKATRGPDKDQEVSGRFEFTYANDSINVDGGDHYVNAENGIIVIADEYINKLEVELDEGVILNARVFRNRNYWAHVDLDAGEADDDVLRANRTIETVVNLQWLGYSDTATTVNLSDIQGNDFWVYGLNEDGGLVFLGRSRENLELRSKYYLSARELDIDTEFEPEEEGEFDPEEYEVPEINPETGGDDSYPSNINDNPGTGK